MLAHSIRAMGVEKELLRADTGPKPVTGQNVTVHCSDFSKNGDLTEKFWSTKDLEQQPCSFQIGQVNVIKGWDEVRNGSRRSLV
ncbi:peptidyl-prolyl cis-trans isomerase fkbp12 [Phtheirospermum japonicum]|uniref:peptidylprolyl isomerase n=1 Tax=Phtheirospermum japonicum TaxID=374723 RepID=A0A830D4C2_9LAMI|nr:peptidyl-prolyl cis-trans isomerase fkbp12 [Phtheirospermum japonicum]